MAIRAWVHRIFLCLSLSFLAVGLKNYNPSVSLDGLLYGSVAQQVANQNAYIRMESGSNVYSPFFEHPHLYFWTLGTWLKFFPQEDWSARIPTHLAFFALLLLVFYFLEKIFSRSVALCFVVFILLQPTFAQWYSNLYIDGFFLTLVVAAFCFLYRRNFFWAGFFLALAAMAKGSTVLATGPSFVALLIYSSRKNTKDFFKALTWASLGFFGLLVSYYVLVAKVFRYPEFFSLHYARHFTNRFAPSWAWSEAFSLRMWKPLLMRSSGLVLLLPIGFLLKEKKRRMACSLVLLWTLTWSLMYGGGARFDGWYTLPFLLGFAIAASLVVDSFLSPGVKNKLLKSEQYWPSAALFLVALVQYTPLRIQYRQIPHFFFELRDEIKREACPVVYTHFDCLKVDTFRCTALTWFSQTTLKTATANEKGCHIADSQNGGVAPQEARRFGDFGFWVSR